MKKRVAILALVAACGVEDSNDLSSDTQALSGGTATLARDAVVKFQRANGGFFCSATMTSPTTFLTAANCIGFAPMQLGGTIIPVSGAEISVKQTFSQGGQIGNDDLAVGVLVEPIQVDWADISSREPKNEELTAIGYGCTTSRQEGECAPDQAQRTFISYKYTGGNSSFYESGDWGSPTFLGFLNDDGYLVRVASGYNVRAWNLTDIGADAVAYKAQLDGLRTTLTNTGVSYRSHVQSLGWTTAVQNGAVSGTTQNLRLEGLQVWTQNQDEHVCYSAWVSNRWQPQVCDGALAGTVGQSLPIQAIKIDRHAGTTQWPLRYRTFSALGWGAWVTNNAVSGTEVNNIEAIQIEFQKTAVIPPGCCTGIN
jgi:hypothetical protein